MLTKKIVKYIQSLNHKKFREQENAFIAEGPKVVEEFILANKNECEWIVAETAWINSNRALLQSVSSDRIIVVPAHRLENISRLKTPNQVLAVFKMGRPADIPDLSGKVSLMLDDLQDPGNLGTIIRIADWFGIQHILCSVNSADCFNPKVVQATMGSLVRVTVIYTDLIAFIQQNRSIPVYAATLNGRSVQEMGRIREGIIIIGNESKGIQESLLRLSGHPVSIPRIGGAESLNAAVATGILLSHLVGSKP